MTRVRSQTQRHARIRPTQSEEYAAFDQLDGRHPWASAMPEGCLLYPVRKLKTGHVAYFNFELGKEMGLIAQDHDGVINKALEQKILATFNLRIVNEYDQLKNVIYHPAMLKPNRYMATRYLQLQHRDRRGKSSGDGRCVWNGVVRHRGRVWDVSSRGTGVTALSPGVNEAGRPLASGNEDFGYGCGMAEIDELYGSAIMAEIFHNNGINTERMLAIIDLGGGVGIGVRASLNLIRPAHLFLYLKQGQHASLTKATEYFIDRQHANKRFSFSAQHPRALDLMLDEVCDNFARFGATLEREYIFAWLDWDGDNVLADAGIIDYGSVRQFGLRHDQYRYDDTDRYSTNLNEQRLKARLTVQVFAQMVDYVKTGNRKPLGHFRGASILKRFDQRFNYYLQDRFLYQLGFDSEDRKKLLQQRRQMVQKLFNDFIYFESRKTARKLCKVADGVNRPAIFNMRNVTRYLPEVLLGQDAAWPKAIWDPKEFHIAMLAQAASRRDSKLDHRLRQRIVQFQKDYKRVIEKACGQRNLKSFVSHLVRRAQAVNRPDRITGNALIVMVEDLLTARRKGLSDAAIQKAIDALVHRQLLDPDVIEERSKNPPTVEGKSRRLLIHFLSVLDGHKEDI